MKRILNLSSLPQWKGLLLRQIWKFSNALRFVLCWIHIFPYWDLDVKKNRNAKSRKIRSSVKSANKLLCMTQSYPSPKNSARLRAGSRGFGAAKFLPIFSHFIHRKGLGVECCHTHIGRAQARSLCATWITTWEMKQGEEKCYLYHW